MSKKLPVNGFRWLDSNEINETNEDFIKNYNENDNKGYIKIKIIFNKDYIYHFYQKEWK